MHQAGKFLIVAGFVLAALGVLLLLSPKVSWLGKLPGDLRFHWGNTEVFIPFTSSLFLSAIATGLVWLVHWMRDKN